MSLKIIKMIADPLFQSNAYILFCEETKAGVVVDPGQPEGFQHLLEEHGITLERIVNTHGHLDHISGVAATKRHFNIPFLIHKEDAFLVRGVNTYTANYGMAEMEVPEIDDYLADGQVITIGNGSIEVIHTPGHSPGSVCLKTGNMVITGDLIFKQSIGRHDLARGDYHTLIHSIETSILSLADEVVLFPGHGPQTTVGEERISNPFLID